MLYTHSGSLPRHQYIVLEPNAIGTHGWLPAVWFGLCSYPGRAWGCHVHLESGAIYRNVPLHHLASRPTDVAWGPADAQTWNCYGYGFSLVQYPYLEQCGIRAKTRQKQEYQGRYLFTAIPIGDGFSASPDQAKEFTFVGLQNGRFTAQPTNHILAEDASFTTGMNWPRFLRRQTEIVDSEHSSPDFSGPASGDTK